MKRLEKISILKEKWRKDQTPGKKLTQDQENEKPTIEETWELWRKKSETSEEKMKPDVERSHKYLGAKLTGKTFIKNSPKFLERG